MDGIIGGPARLVQKNPGKKSRVSHRATVRGARMQGMDHTPSPVPHPTSGSITRQLLAAEIARVRLSVEHHSRALDALEEEAKPHRVKLEEARRKLARLLDEEGRA